MKNSRSGFTLIELLVVIAIIGILSTLAVVSLGSARTRARDSKRLADMRSLQSALEIYYTDQSSYPVATASGLCIPGTTLEGCCLENQAGDTAEPGWRETCDAGDALITVPTDPRNNAADQYAYSRPDANTYYVQFFPEGDPDGTNGPLTGSGTPACLSQGGFADDATPAGCP